jgi:hypothetical protein
MEEKPHKYDDNEASLKDRGSRPMSAAEWCSTGRIHVSTVCNRLAKTMYSEYIYSINREAQHSDF